MFVLSDYLFRFIAVIPSLILSHSTYNTGLLLWNVNTRYNQTNVLLIIHLIYIRMHANATFTKMIQSQNNK
jgi:hypothetical protein